MFKWPWSKHRKPTIKPLEELSKEEADQISLEARRAALHRAVDMGLLDELVDDRFPHFEPIPEGPNYLRSDK